MAQTTELIALALIQPPHGITFALLHLACMRLLARIVPQGTAQAIYGTVGIGAASELLTLPPARFTRVWARAAFGSWLRCARSPFR